MQQPIGHERTMQFLARSLERGTLAHAYLFVGPERVGKMTAARAFAATLLGTETLETHPDFFAVERGHDPKSGKLRGEIVLAQIHALCGKLALGAFMNGWKVCVLDGAHLLNTESANALLKTLEEPHDKTLLILLAPDASAVLPTIRSRCQVLRLGRVPRATIAAALETRGVPVDRADLLSRLADGRLGAAFAFAADPAELQEMVALREALLRLPGMPVADRLATVEKFLPQKASFQESVDRSRAVIDLAAELLRDALLASHGRAERGVHADVRERVIAWATSASPRSLAAAAEELSYGRRLLDDNVNPRAVLGEIALAF